MAVISPALVVCFGDSLTVGFQSPSRENPGGIEAPYGRFLQEHLGSAVRVQISGVCGEVTGDMVERFRRSVAGRKPDYVVILGGTNDVGRGISPEQITANLTALYELTVEAGGVPIPVTVPSSRLEGNWSGPDASVWKARHLDPRVVLNRLIRDYAESHSLAVVDLFSATLDSESGQLAAIYSNDGLHFTTAGYRRFAELVADVLRPKLQSKV
jgi:lysophospholipase L1-like esterase